MLDKEPATAQFTAETLFEAVRRMWKAEYEYPQWTENMVWILNPADKRALEAYTSDE